MRKIMISSLLFSLACVTPVFANTGSAFVELVDEPNKVEVMVDAEQVASESEKTLSQRISKIEERLGDHLKISGFIIGRAQYSTNESNYGGFDIRFLRFIVAGNISNQFSYRYQMEFAGGPRILDAWVHWKKWDGFQVRVGEQKRNFTFENYISPVSLGVSEYSQVILKLSGFFDRVGEQASGGRDVGVLLMGDLFKRDGFHQLHYGVGVFNGNGINKLDDNKRKDLFLSLIYEPMHNLQLGSGYWDGNYGPEGETVDRKRWNFGLKYIHKNYMLRSEYIYSKGQIPNKPTSSDCSDGWYVAGEVLVVKKLRAHLKYDVYRDNAKLDTQITRYFSGWAYQLHKNITLQATYFYQDDRNLGAQNTHSLVAQLAVRY